MAHQQVADQRRNAGGEQHGVDVGAQLFLLHQAVEDNAQHRRPDVQDVDAPGAEAQGQHEGQGGDIIDRRAAHDIQPQAAQPHQTHIQERRGIAAHGKIVGGNFPRLAHDLPQAGKHGIPVRHTHSRDQKRRGKEAEKQLQERAFLQIFYCFHKSTLLSILNLNVHRQKGRPSVETESPRRSAGFSLRSHAV